MKTKKEIAAGTIVICKETCRILLGRRSGDVSDSNFWSIFGGGFNETDAHPKNTVYREFLEETGFKIESISSKPLYVFTNNFIEYYTYISFVEKEFAPKLNSEHIDYGWFYLKDLDDVNLHYGLRELLNNKEVRDILEKTINRYAKKTN